MCQNAFQPFSSKAGGGDTDFILGDAFLRNVYSLYDFGDFIQGYSGLPQGDPYIKLLPLTDATAASAEFKTARAASLSAAGMPPQIDPTTINGSPRALPGTGGGARAVVGGLAAMVLLVLWATLWRWGWRERLWLRLLCCSLGVGDLRCLLLYLVFKLTIPCYNRFYLLLQYFYGDTEVAIECMRCLY
jgi:hypothetical protein